MFMYRQCFYIIFIPFLFKYSLMNDNVLSAQKAYYKDIM